MGLELNKLYDPRTPLQKARRKELERFAKANGVKEVKPGMPAPLMRKILQERGLTQIDLPPTRWLGGPTDMQTIAQRKQARPEPAEEIDELAILRAEWERESQDFSTLSINDLRSECKKRGIKLSRRDNMESMKEKLLGEDPS